MSWSNSYQSREKFDADERDVQENLSPEAEEQVQAARAAAKALIESGAAGGEGKDFSVSMYGHANPGHEPMSGSAYDCIGVTVSQK